MAAEARALRRAQADAPRAASGRRASTHGLLRISELARRAGVSVGTVKHYLREGLLPEPLRTSRNMAYYPPEFAERIRLIKQLQEERFLPLKLIASMLDDEPERVRAMLDVEDRILERAVAASERGRTSRAQVMRVYEMPANVLDRLAQLGILTPSARGYDADDVAIIEAISRFRAGGYDEAIGFTVYDTLRYRDALTPLVADEVQVLRERLPGEVPVERAVEIIASGVEPLRELIGAMHSKLLLAELSRQRGPRETGAHRRRSGGETSPHRAR